MRTYMQVIVRAAFMARHKRDPGIFWGDDQVREMEKTKVLPAFFVEWLNRPENMYNKLWVYDALKLK